MGKMRELRKRAIIDTLAKHDGNRTRAARELGISIRGLRNLIREFNLAEPQDPIAYEALGRRAEHIARRIGAHQDAEDIGQEVVVNYLLNGKGQTVQQATIDVVRSLYGSTRGGRMSRATGVRRAERFAMPVHELRDKDAAATLALDGSRFIDAFLSTARGILEKSKRAVVVLIYEWGFTEKEIGDLFGLSESRISQIRSEVEARVLKVMAREEPREEPGILPDGRPKEASGSSESREGPREMARVLLREAEERSRVECEANSGMAEGARYRVEGFNEESVPEWFA